MKQIKIKESAFHHVKRDLRGRIKRKKDSVREESETEEKKRQRQRQTSETKMETRTETKSEKRIRLVESDFRGKTAE